ncbi:hypothetical protein QYE76_070175 [Lolium multiflorum]|uniref:Reverse transcriptase domain-containing protein n=1 Tax=Lolium multiflorum TaxID=4521 RepID=A0AAD8WE76_LOLMU|nr:hypothetical protein QYE76_070175 [Lolium multiflorum]
MWSGGPTTPFASFSSRNPSSRRPKRGSSRRVTAASAGRRTPERKELSGGQESAGEIPSRGEIDAIVTAIELDIISITIIIISTIITAITTAGHRHRCSNLVADACKGYNHNETFIETACQHLLLLVGIDILTYRRYYDTPLYLWVIKTIFWRRCSEALLQHLEDSESEVFRKERDELEEIFLRQPILKHDLPVEDLGTTPPPKEDPVFDLKPLPDNLKYAHIDDKKIYPVIISSKLTEFEEERLLQILKKHRGAIGYTLDDLKGISPSICQHAINMEDDAKPVVEPQRRLIPKMKDVVRNEVLRLLEAGIIYPIADSRWVSPVHCVPKKGGMTVVPNDNDELIPQRVVVGYRMCIDYRKVNKVTKKDHYPLPFIDQMLERLSKNTHFCFLDGYSGFSQIAVKAKDQEKTTFTCPYGTYAYRRMPFGLCNAPATFQRCMSAIFHGFCESIVERCEETNLVLNWEKCHFMVNEGIVLGHKISEKGIEVDRAKVEAIEKMPYPRDVKAASGRRTPERKELSGGQESAGEIPEGEIDAIVTAIELDIISITIIIISTIITAITTTGHRHRRSNLAAGGTFMSITLGAATKLLDKMMINYSEWHTERAPQGKKVNSVEETSSLSDKIDVIMSMLVNGRSNVDPNNVPLASLVAQEENVDVNFIKNNNFNNNAYRNNSSNNYRPYPYNNGNGYGNSYGNSYNNNRSVPPGLESMLKEFISTQTAFNKSVEEKLDKIDILASRVDRLASDVDLLKSKVMPNKDIENKIVTTANSIQVRINENIRLMAELRARWDREENEKLAKENNVAKVWTITTTSNVNDSYVAAPPTINGQGVPAGGYIWPTIVPFVFIQASSPYLCIQHYNLKGSLHLFASSTTD